MKKYRQSQVIKLMEKSSKSNIAKSARRIYFNGLFESIEERGHWHIDTMSGMGSCILIKFNDKFFLLTASHVLKGLQDEDGNFPNESPFWTSVKHKVQWETMYDFLMPKKIWNIGELINTDDIIITSDVVLVELYYPFPLHMPDNFIDIKNDKIFSKKEDFYHGKILQLSGFPFEKNSYNWDVKHPNPIFTHSTSINRHTYPGMFIDDSELGHISFEITDADVQHKNTNGMSGGVVYDVQHKANQTRFCGMVVTISNNIGRFIPSYLLYNAIISYENATCVIVDPIENLTPNLEEGFEHFKSYIETFVIKEV